MELVIEFEFFKYEWKIFSEVNHHTHWHRIHQESMEPLINLG